MNLPKPVMPQTNETIVNGSGENDPWKISIGDDGIYQILLLPLIR